MADNMATLQEIRKYFGYASATLFRQEWMALTEEDRIQLKAGIGNGTFTY